MRDRPNNRHRVVARAVRGHPLHSTDVVHHQNEDKADNTVNNLTVTSRREHTIAHNRTRGLSRLRAALRMIREHRRLY